MLVCKIVVEDAPLFAQSFAVVFPVAAQSGSDPLRTRGLSRCGGSVIGVCRFPAREPMASDPSAEGDACMMDGVAGVGPWMMLLWGLFALIILALILSGAIWLIRELADRPERSLTRRDTPEEVLRRRYAAGEIDEDEFYHRMRDLDES
ncbi:SHOCT domain-containing protein [Phytoactinopolyspora halotolerans]|uniref:SHOCT domain-containing protein n=1 Tax=Phytoactinopolyspora halotolerans TaxID=1981512 RepID=A0A6L9SB69_9ACTN|nr:hypothetical protein [Phytoactinopolyspora halotolerans]NEE02605.1 hypothetical protein [Phytoactinopolyspora halotolerans]